VISDPTLTVTCDLCAWTELELPGHLYSHEITDTLEREGWGTNDDGEDICPKCVRENAE
jgi:hypothetical protein